MGIRQLAEYFLFSLMKCPVAMLSRPALIRLAGALGSGIYVLDRKHRRIALENLTVAFKNLSLNEKKRIGRGAFRHFSRFTFDLLAIRKMAESGFNGLVRHEGLDHLNEAYAEGRGVLIFTAHFGHWEMMGVSQGQLNLPLNVIARPLDNERLETALLEIRTCSGNRVIPKSQAIRGALEALKKGEGVAILIDQNSLRSKGIFVDFFGKQACTTTLLASLALKTGARIIPAFSLPDEEGGYRFIYEAPIPLPDEAMDVGEKIHEITQRCTKVIEAYIRRYPEYWLWMHQRWKTRPLP
jgi:KDO2-lipid IV(A) lauroyltransferase